jgi:hypothetical protein
LERDDILTAAAEARAGLVVSRGLSGSGSYANRYWTMFLIGRVFLILWRLSLDAGRRWEPFANDGAAAARFLRRLSSAHPIARPALLLIRGGSCWLSGRHRGAIRAWQGAASTATSFGMRYELELARDGLASAANQGPTVARAVDGLPLLRVRGEVVFAVPISAPVP